MAQRRKYDKMQRESCVIRESSAGKTAAGRSVDPAGRNLKCRKIYDLSCKTGICNTEKHKNKITAKEFRT